MVDIAVGRAPGSLWKHAAPIAGPSIEWTTATTEQIYDEMHSLVREMIAEASGHVDGTLAQWAAEYPDAGPNREALDELRGAAG